MSSSSSPVHACSIYTFVSEDDELAHMPRIVARDLAGRRMLKLEADPEYNDTVDRLLSAYDVTRGADVMCGQVGEFPRFVRASDAVFLSTGHMPHYPGDGMAMVPVEEAGFEFCVGLYYRRANAGFLVSSFANIWL